MNTILQRTALVVRDLLAYDEQLIKIGRQNFERKQLEMDYIVIDSLAPMQRVASSKVFDDVNEIMSYDALMSGRLTVDFYGLAAYTNATRLSLLMNSQKALELKDSNGITLCQATGITDVKALIGQQYGERVQIEVTAFISISASEPILRIDTPKIQIQTKRGIQYAN